jgi:Asp-tRNA(Asn)/Glu-tRNA(Gln) amidotransferase A subunit family amidase
LLPAFATGVCANARQKTLISQAIDTPAYLSALEKSLRLSRDEGIDAVMDQYQLDALVAPTGPPAWVIDYATGDPILPYPLHSVAARAGYPVITVPAGFARGLPVGISFVGRAFSEPATPFGVRVRAGDARPSRSAVSAACGYLTGF